MNKTLILIPVVFSSLLLLSACEKEEVVHDVEWYLAHEDELDAKIEECKNNPGELSKTPNCINAGQAERKRQWRDFDPRDHPVKPMGIDLFGNSIEKD